MGFSSITAENWLLPDRKNYIPLGTPPPDQWIVRFLQPTLAPTVPLEVRRVFEIARGAMIYSWFFYPLATLGLEQCTRIAEFAVRERCQMLQNASDNFAQNLRALVSAGVISPEDEQSWQGLRFLRNDRSHLRNFMLTDPGEASGFMRVTVERINRLFSGTTQPTQIASIAPTPTPSPTSPPHHAPQSSTQTSPATPGRAA
jgi:hypothetical protein